MKMRNSIYFFAFILPLFSCCNERIKNEIHFVNLSSPPGARSDNTVTLVWDVENTLQEGYKYLVKEGNNEIATTNGPFYKAKGLTPDSLYDFRVMLKNTKGTVVGKSNTIKVRTKPNGKIFNVVDHGAIGNGQTLNTKSIQAAIDSCGHSGTVLIPKGIYVTGALFVKSNMTLFIEEGAVIKGSAKLADYPIVMARFEGLETEQYASIINGGELCGKGIQNFSIQGKGIIDGEGEALFILQKKRGKIKRGRIVSLINGENIYLEGVSFLESPSRGLQFVYCNGVTVENVTVNTRYNPETGVFYKLSNGDGITFSSTKNAYLFNSVISSQDDNISIKSGRNEEGRRVGKATEHIRIFNCKFTVGLGVVTGSEMSGGIRDVVVNNCEFENTAFVAQLKAPWGRGSVIENIAYKNITHNDTIHGDNKWHRGAICIDQYYGDESPNFSIIHEVDENMPIIRDAWFENISISRNEGKAIYLCGRPEMYVKNINFKNIHAKAPEGLFGLYVEQIRLDNVKIEQESGESLNWENIIGLEIENEKPVK